MLYANRGTYGGIAISLYALRRLFVAWLLGISKFNKTSAFFQSFSHDHQHSWWLDGSAPIRGLKHQPMPPSAVEALRIIVEYINAGLKTKTISVLHSPA